MVVGKKGVTRIPLVVGTLTITVLTFAMFFIFIENLFTADALGNADFVAKDIATTMSITYSAPESVSVAYEVPVGADGYPQIGSFLLDAEHNKIGISPYSEDQMWTSILKNALVAWGVGEATSVGTRAIKAKFGKVGERRAAKATVRLDVENAIALKKLFGEKVSRSTRKKLFSEATDEELKLAKEARRAKRFQSIRTLASKVGTLLRSSASKVYRTIFRKGGEKIEASSATAAADVPWSTALCLQSTVELSNPVTAPAGIAKKILNRGLLAIFFIVDFWTVTVPIVSMIDQGVAQSRDMADTITWRTYAGSAEEVYVDPPNCEPDVEFVDIEVPHLGTSKISTPKHIPVPMPASKEGNPQKIENTKYIDDSGRCVDTQNVFIAKPQRKQFEFEFPYYVGSATITEASFVTGGSRYACSAVGYLCPAASYACTVGLYSGFIWWFYNKPESLLRWWLQPGFLDKEQYYYMAFPIEIQFSKSYNEFTGESNFEVIKVG